MEYICLLIKPSSDKCNMRCKYCFYEDIAKTHSEKLDFMSEQTAENLIKQTFSAVTRQVTFMFQGGEPTLIGLEFYRFFTNCVKAHNSKGVKVHYAIQTNGYLLDDEWAEFFGENHFLVGLSVDGTKELHDLNRIDAQGSGTFQRVIKSTEILKAHNVSFNILTVVTNQLARRAQAVYNFYKKQGYGYLQFIPCLNPIEKMDERFDYTLDSQRYGKFLCMIFDLWVQDIKKGSAPSIRQFDNYIMMLKGMPPESCGFSGICSAQNVVEADGSVYPCDFYVLDNLKLGNINQNTFEQINKKREELEFIKDSQIISDKCKACELYTICRGGCRRYREPFNAQSGGDNIFCEGYKMFFAHALPTLLKLAQYR